MEVLELFLCEFMFCFIYVVPLTFKDKRSFLDVSIPLNIMWGGAPKTLLNGRKENKKDGLA